MTLLSDTALKTMAHAMLAMMDDPSMWDSPPPPCTSAAHDWSIVSDTTVTWEDGDATWSKTHRVAIVCGHCEFVVGIT